MVPTPAQKRVIDNVLSLFETGHISVPASYATCTILKDGAGISYGKHQCTDRAGSLDLVVQRYIQKKGQYAEELSGFLPYLAQNRSCLEGAGGEYTAETQRLVDVLKAAGLDPVMQAAQDEVFDEVYFTPALAHAANAGVTKALSLLVIYDTCVHSGPGGVTTIRNLFPEKSPAGGGNEEAWVRAYINARRAWLAGSANSLVQKTVYRMDALLALVNSGNWDLATPLRVQGVLIT